MASPGSGYAKINPGLALNLADQIAPPHGPAA
jgi:hypothetical protein